MVATTVQLPAAIGAVWLPSSVISHARPDGDVVTVTLFGVPSISARSKASGRLSNTT
jgi:hypothetical protein